MDGKKISFGFMKTKKAAKPVVEEKKEYIECLEEQSIKVVGGEPVEEKAPLVIALKPNTLITAERLRQIAEEVESSVQEPEIKTEKPDPAEEKAENETLEQMAVRELLQESKKPVKVENDMYTVPIPAQPVLDGQKESTLEDYESVPIQEFGLAMLRGMGWAPGKEQSKLKEPQLRPKGLGLGADKVIKKKVTKTEKDGKELTMVVNAFVKVINGKHSGYYGKIMSLDEDSGRVVVDLAMKKETVSLGEFMLQPVTKAEFDRESRVINSDKYEEYKKNENAPQKSQRSEEPHCSRNSREQIVDNQNQERKQRAEGKEYRDKSEDRSNGRSRERRRSSEERDRRKERKRYSSNDSVSSSDCDKRKRERNRKNDSSDSESSPQRQKKNKKHRSKSRERKRDIDKKRKGKKKRRDRDRSPNYRKHRK